MRRREFTRLALAGAIPSLAAAKPETIRAGDWRLSVEANGEIVSLHGPFGELVDRRLGGGSPMVAAGSDWTAVCERPVRRRREGARLVFEYELPHGLLVDYAIELTGRPGASATVKQTFGIRSASRIPQDVTVSIPRNLRLPTEGRNIFLPLRDGIGRTQAVDARTAVFELSGACRGGSASYLAIPVIDEYSDRSDLHLTWCADPFFTSAFRLPFENRPGEIHWTYLGKTGIGAREERTISTVLHRDGLRGAMEAFCRACLGQVNPGPDWLHDVSMAGYDYLSKHGKGWYADIDTLERVIALEDRPKVLLAMHGWYDFVGRYAYDSSAKRLVKSWTAFPNSLSPEFRKTAERVPSFQRLRPVPMSIAEVHARLHYAKSRGFRVALYFADGVTSCEGAKGVHDPVKALKWEGWSGPDTAGKSYAQNPLHPDVRDFYASYLNALLAEYGGEFDALVWDETHTVRVGDMGPERFPGYADRAMMNLVRDLTRTTQSFRSELAFLVSDNIGLYGYKAPYCLMAHGTYQDSSCREKIWPYGLFTNYRNVLWSCNWSPLKHFDRTRYGVDTFDTPVTIANGHVEDIGVSEMTAEQLGRILALFNARKQRSMRVGWIEEQGGQLVYQGRKVLHHDALPH